MFRVLRRGTTQVNLIFNRSGCIQLNSISRNNSNSRSPQPRLHPRMAKQMLKEDAVNLIGSVDNYLFDCDGVLWDGHGPIDGSKETILKLKKLGKKVYYVTNNSSRTRQECVDKCHSLGFPAELDDIMCTAYMAAQYLKMKNFQGKVYLVGREESMGKELTEVGIPYIGTGLDPYEYSSFEGCLKTELDPEVNCVLVGFDPYISYLKICKAASYLKNPDCLFVATNEDPCLPLKGKILVPGTGTMVAAIKTPSERTPIVVGKPELGMFEVLQNTQKFDPTRSIMVGDRLDTDILFAQRCGMKSLAVLSGHVTKEDVVSPTLGFTADFYADYLGVLGNFLN